MKIIKNVFKTQGSGVMSTESLKELVAQCTLDGSTVHRIKRDYSYCRLSGPDNITIIWTKKEEDKK